jgi:sarcosine oxidase subunit beta
MAAYYLRQRGRSVVVLERAFVGGESSGVSFGSLRLQGQHETELPFALRAQDRWERIEAELGESLEFAQHGLVHLAISPEQVERLETNAAHMRRFGLGVEVMERSDALRHWPFLSEKVVAASWSRRDAVINPRLAAPAFARAALRCGAKISERTEVIDAHHANGRFFLRVRSVDGDVHEVTSESVINATGAWCGTFAAHFGEFIPVLAAGPAEMVTEPVPHFVDPVIHVVDGSVLFRQTSRGNVIIGGHPRMRFANPAHPVRVPPDKIRTNLARLIAIAPHMCSHHVIRTWTGLEGYIEDMKPVLGPSATTPGLYHACAFSGHGLQVGPAVGLVLAELIVDGRTETSLTPFDIRRFGSGPLSERHSMAEEFQDIVTPTESGR